MILNDKTYISCAFYLYFVINNKKNQLQKDQKSWGQQYISLNIFLITI